MHNHDDDPLFLIVTGAHLRAERRDRPLAYRLRDRVEAELHARAAHGVIGNGAANIAANGAAGHTPTFEVLVCSDIWWLNNEHLALCPTIAIGDPETNALTAYLGDKIPSVFAVDGALVVQADLTFHDLLAACWGADEHTTAAAVDAFIERYLADFLEAARDRAAV